MTTPVEVLADTVARIRAQYEWAQLATSSPEADDGDWAPFEAFATPEARERAAAAFKKRYYEDRDVPEGVLGTYVFRDLIYHPLLVLGYCFAGEMRVPLLSGAIEIRLDETGPVRLREARFAVLPGDDLVGMPGVEVEPDLVALTERLFVEVAALCDPLLANFRAVRHVAPANGWGSILDALLVGFTTAGRSGLGLDEAWARWNAAIEGRAFPVRRRPRRLAYEWAPGQHDEMSVRAGCCLWYTTDEAKAAPKQHYCTSCYLETDESRIRHMVEWKQKIAAGEADANH